MTNQLFPKIVTKLHQARPVLGISVLISFSLILSGCASSPEVLRSTISPPPAFQNQSAKANQPLPSRSSWWLAFGDKTLEELIKTSLNNNRDIAQALARIEQARSRTTDDHGAKKPEIGITTILQRGDEGRDAQPVSTINPGLRAGYEVDLFGRLRAAVSSANANLLANEADLEALKMTLASDVVISYLQFRYANLQLTIYDQRYNALRDLLAIDRVRLETGVSDASGLARTQADLDQLISDRANAQREKALAVARLATLTATPGLHISEAEEIKLLSVPFADTPVEVLRRRPDIRAAEARLAAANDQAYQTYAARFPSLKLSTSAGFASQQFSNLLERASLSWAIGAVLDATIFDGGRKKAQQSEALARAKEAAAATDAALLKAMEEVEVALATYEVEDKALDAIKDALIQSKRLEKLADSQRSAGAVGRQVLLEATLATQSAELNKLTHERARQIAVVNAARALAL